MPYIISYVMLCYVEKQFTICTLLDAHPYVVLHHLYSTILCFGTWVSISTVQQSSISFYIKSTTIERKHDVKGRACGSKGKFLEGVN